MKINYRLEVEYQVFEKKGNIFFETKSYIFNSGDSIQNRKDAINKYASFKHIFELTNDTSEHIKLSVTEIINKNESGFKIPFMNIYYTTEEFSSENKGTVLFGGYLNEFNERINELEQERKLYESNHILELKTENFEDFKGAVYIVINNSPFEEEDFCRFKNNYAVNMYGVGML